MTAAPSLLPALQALWAVPAPGPDSLQSLPAFAALTEACDLRFGRGKARFAVSAALRSLGLPCTLPAGRQALATDPVSAAAALEAAFTQTRTTRRHFCPLDFADDLPELSFGRSRVGRFSPEELESLFDAPRLARNFSARPLDVVRLAQFHWLVVEEEVDLDPRPEARTVPVLFKTLQGDLGEFDPLDGRFPPAVERALFFLLLAPWEDWSTMPSVDWRGFQLPWIYTLDLDLFTHPAVPPSPDSLSLEPWIVQDHWGDELELERPTTFPLDDAAKPALSLFTDGAWAQLEAARASELFETPVAHFLVRAFLADGMDEVMAHMTVIEAALGLESDHRKWQLPKNAPFRGLSATDRVAARMVGLLDDPKSGQTYKDLFELRSSYVHGRVGLAKISTRQRVNARSLARRVSRQLVDAAGAFVGSRAAVLADLLCRGATHL